jgi:hypothetical protein
MNKLLLIAFLATSVPVAAQQMPSGYYLSTYGSDDALVKHPNGCFASAVFRSNQCISGVILVNHFAVKYQGAYYCHKDKSPAVDKPLLGVSRGSEVVSVCTTAGWRYSRN